jgi:hypothetical protein
MTFVSGQGANFDPNYPERAYIPLSSGYWNYTYKFKFPDGLSGDLVLLQWHYVTANSCTPSGYKEYNWPSGNDWHMASNLIVGSCGTLPLDGNGAPEQVGISVNLHILFNSYSCFLMTFLYVTTNEVLELCRNQVRSHSISL